MSSVLDRATRAFPLWVLGASLGAVLWPPAFTWFSGPFITYGLGLIMLGMGLTLRVEDFTRVARYPSWVLVGIALQYTVMPASGWLLGRLFGLPAPLAVGLVLVACCPGGTASNVISYLARANVALSVTMTALSTLAAVVVTPTLTEALAGSRMNVDGWGLFIETIKVVIVPVALGAALNRYAPGFTRRATVVSPLIAVLLIAMIVASILGAGLARIVEGGLRLVGAVLSLHLSGFAFGYLISRVVSRDESVARTVSIEVGMQNSGLGAHLARSNFPPGLGVDVPSALSALTHCVYGSVLAALWQRFPPSADRSPRAPSNEGERAAAA
ncbi:MAG: bile acid:sodium symporter family protein [Polyangiaceae bacterium]|nr:bile acid:sodium symporter family protein [Polyangiaceae bacterium]